MNPAFPPHPISKWIAVYFLVTGFPEALCLIFFLDFLFDGRLFEEGSLFPGLNERDNDFPTPIATTIFGWIVFISTHSGLLLQLGYFRTVLRFPFSSVWKGSSTFWLWLFSAIYNFYIFGLSFDFFSSDDLGFAPDLLIISIPIIGTILSIIALINCQEKASKTG